MTLIIVLIVIGLILLVAEFLVIPGFTVAGVAGFVLIIFGIYLGYSQFGVITGHIILLSTAVASVATIAISLRSKTWSRVMLNDSVDSKALDEYDHFVKPGDEGIAVSRLAPMGKAKINDHVVEVAALGELIDQQSPIEVVKVDGNKITVKLKK
ncbi:MAG: NfeD family protein [Bacteroidales bacterium]